MSRDFQKINIPKLPVLTTEDAIIRIKEFFGKLNEWKNIDDLLPLKFLESKNLKKTGKAGIFSGSLELAKEGNISIKQNNLFASFRQYLLRLDGPSTGRTRRS